MSCHALLQGIFPTQGSNPCLLHLLRWQMDSQGDRELTGEMAHMGRNIVMTRLWSSLGWFECVYFPRETCSHKEEFFSNHPGHPNRSRFPKMKF